MIFSCGYEVSAVSTHFLQFVSTNACLHTSARHRKKKLDSPVTGAKSKLPLKDESVV